MGSSQKVIKGVVWTTLLNIINAIYGFIAVPILINYFGKGEYGLIGLAMSINVYMQLMDMGFNSTNVRFFSNWLAKGEKENVYKGFQTSMSFYGIIGILNAGVLLIISIFSSTFFNVSPNQDVILKHLFYVLAVSSFFSWYTSCFDQLIKATENVAWVQQVSIIPKLLMICVLFITVYGNLSIEWYYILTCLTTVLVLPAYMAKIKSVLPYISFTPKIDFPILKKILPYCLNIFSFAIFQFSFYNLRPVFLGILGTPEDVADYRVMNGIVGIVSMVGGAFMGALIPSCSKLVAENNSKAYYRVAYMGTKFISIAVCFCCFGMMSVGPEMITLYVGDNYLHLMPWLNLWLICTLSTHNQAISSLILSGDDIRAISYSSVISSIIGLITAWILIPYYGVGGTVIAFCVYLVIQIGFYYLYYWPYKMKINSYAVFTKCFFPFVFIGAFLYYGIQNLPLYLSTMWLFLLKGIIFLCVYILLIWLFLTKEDKDIIVGYIQKNNR